MHSNIVCEADMATCKAVGEKSIEKLIEWLEKDDEWMNLNDKIKIAE